MKKDKENFSKLEVQNLIKRIINQESFGDIHHEAGKVQQEYGMNFNEDLDEDDESHYEDIDLDDDEINLDEDNY